jgi:hypothetical protein
MLALANPQPRLTHSRVDGKNQPAALPASQDVGSWIWCKAPVGKMTEKEVDEWSRSGNIFPKLSEAVN